MDPILQVLLSWQFMLFSLAVAVVVFVIRTITDSILELKSLPTVSKNSKYWREIVLPILPILIGVGFGIFITSFPYPNGLTMLGGRVIFGLVAGAVSTTLYRVIKSLLTQKISSVVQTVQSAVNTTTVVQTPDTTTTTSSQVQVNSSATGDNIDPSKLPNRGQQ